MKRMLFGMLAAVTLLAFAISSGTGPERGQASTPGSTVVPLLSCPTISGGGTVDLFNDIFGVAFKYGTDADDVGPGEPDGYHVLYDVGVADGSIDLFNDIFGVAFDFGTVCPLVDQQVAKATLWGIANLPKTNDAAGVAALAALGYLRSSSDVPGQGVHYTKHQNWDGNFDPEAPEGVVYNNGKLAAQLYVVDGNDPDITWGGYAAGPCSPGCPGAIHGKNLEGAFPEPGCSPDCSWEGGEGWHLHYYLCTLHVGTVNATSLPASYIPILSTEAGCAAYGDNTDPPGPAYTVDTDECPVVITSSDIPCYRWAPNVGWMGHLWNHELNPNQIADTGGNNGRFADCTPDGSTWKAFTCPG